MEKRPLREKMMDITQRHRLAIGLLLLTFLAQSATAQFGSPTISVNGQMLNQNQLQEYYQTYGFIPNPGHYWYDSETGLYGMMGGPSLGAINPGHQFGPLPADASRGQSGVFLNGRQLTTQEVMFFVQALGRQIPPGRYRMDASAQLIAETAPDVEPSPPTNQPTQPQTTEPQLASQCTANGSLDPKLVGTFKGESVYAGDGIGMNTQLNWHFMADGSVYYGAQSHYNAGGRDSAGNTSWSAGGTTDGDTQRGCWSTNNKILVIQWDDGDQTRVAYGFEPDGSLVYRNWQTRKLINFFPRLR